MPAIADDAPLVVVHEDRKIQRLLARALGATSHPIVVAAGVDQARTMLGGRIPALVVAAASRLQDAFAVDGGGPVVAFTDAPRTVVLPMVTAGPLEHLIGGILPVAIDEIMATVQKLLRRDLFGLEKYLGWSATIEATELASTLDRRRALDDLRATLARIGLPARQTGQAILIADELMSNAVHNAPVDERGEAFLRDLGRDTERALVGRDRPLVRWGSDGRLFAIEVTDRYGTLTPDIVRRHVGKLLARDCEIRSGTGGAGLGLAMTYDAARALVFNLEPGRRTQAIGVVDVQPRDDASMPAPSLHLFHLEPAND